MHAIMLAFHDLGFDDAIRADGSSAERAITLLPALEASIRTAIATADHPPGEAFAERLGRAFRGPLDRVVAAADMLSLGHAGRADDDIVATIAASARQLLALVDEVVDLQRIERPDFRPNAEPIDLADIARQACGLLTVRAAANGVHLMRPPDAQAIMVLGDFGRSLQIMLGLLGNAVRNAPRGTAIWMRCVRAEHSAALIVVDEGPGISPFDQERIFLPFQRVDGDSGPGAGLGLYVGRLLARAMRGDLIVESPPGEGACFILTLPLVPA
jgi:signal transduction histidine kinase